jgi:DNA-binding MarR family transcriptional regulator
MRATGAGRTDGPGTDGSGTGTVDGTDMSGESGRTDTPVGAPDAGSGAPAGPAGGSMAGSAGDTDHADGMDRTGDTDRTGDVDGTRGTDGMDGSPGAPPGGAGGPVATDAATDALERELTVLFRRARASSGELARAVHPELEAAAYGLLVRLEEAEPERATDLAAYFGVGKATMSRQLRALEELGLVTREPDPADGRAFLMRMTDEGRERYARVRGARRERYLRRLAGWDRGEVAELSRLLHRFNELTR